MEFSTQSVADGGHILITPVDPRQPKVRAFQRLVSDEGDCKVWVGKRDDNDETTVVSTPCANATHRKLFERFTDLMKWSASGDTESDRLLLDVCKDLLMEASTEVRTA